MGRANGNCNGFRMKAFDLVQTVASHQSVFRRLQIEQRDFHETNFLSCITVYGGPRPFCENFHVYGTYRAPQSKLQTLGCTKTQGEIFAQKIRRAESKE